MVFHSDHEIYQALPIASDALEKGGVKLLRAGFVDEELFVTARCVFAEPAQWGYVLPDIMRRLAAIYASERNFTETKVSAAIAGAFARSLRSGPGAAKRRPAQSARPRAKARGKSSIKAVRRKSARTKP